MPGGFGAAKNLSTFATEGADSKGPAGRGGAGQGLRRGAQKPVGMMCIAPTMAAEIFGAGVICTLGSDDADAAKAVGQMGTSHRACEVSDIVVDKQHRPVTTPAYMLAQSISEAASGIYKLVDRVLEMTTED